MSGPTSREPGQPPLQSSAAARARRCGRAAPRWPGRTPEQQWLSLQHLFDVLATDLDRGDLYERPGGGHNRFTGQRGLSEERPSVSVVTGSSDPSAVGAVNRIRPDKIKVICVGTAPRCSGSHQRHISPPSPGSEFCCRGSAAG